MKKKVMSLLLVLVMGILMMTGCKKNVGTPEDNAASGESEEDEATPTFTFGYTCSTMDNPYYITLEAAIREQVENKGNSLISMNPGLDAQVQINQIKEMIDQGIDVIFLSPVDWEAVQPAIDALKEADVKIINIDSEIKDMDSVDAYIGTDNKNAGFVCGENLIERYPNGGKIVILESPSVNSMNDRITGFEEAIANKGFEVVARADVQGDLNTALEKATTIFTEHKDIVAVMCGNDPSALGTLVAANSANLKDIAIYGIDGSPDLKKELAKPESLIAGTAAQSPINMGKTAVDIALKLLNGEDFERETYEETYFINKENVDMYGIDGWQ
ncbi:sugar ABC transporter substrate-binding protein [Lachnospiraceae bacterium LCP25S3_G4]